MRLSILSNCPVLTHKPSLWLILQSLDDTRALLLSSFNGNRPYLLMPHQLCLLWLPQIRGGGGCWEQQQKSCFLRLKSDQNIWFGCEAHLESVIMHICVKSILGAHMTPISDNLNTSQRGVSLFSTSLQCITAFLLFGNSYLCCRGDHQKGPCHRHTPPPPSHMQTPKRLNNPSTYLHRRDEAMASPSGRYLTPPVTSWVITAFSPTCLPNYRER